MQNLYSTLAELHKLIDKTPDTTSDKIILIGGQALIVWVHAFQIEDFSPSAYDNLSSDDLDFIGEQQAVVECARCWNGKASLPDVNDSTPQTGRVILAEHNEKGEMMTVDFLGAAYGIPSKDAEKYSDKLTLGSGAFFQVISPPLCLLSRIKNLTGYLRGADELIHKREVSRIQSAIAITGRYVQQLAEYDISEGVTERTKTVVNYLVKSILKDNDTIAVANKYDIDFSSVFPELIAQVHPDIYSKLIINALEQFNDKVNRKKSAEKIRAQQKSQKLARLRSKSSS